MHRSLAETIDHLLRAPEQSSHPTDRAHAVACLAALAPLLARIVLGETVLRECEAVDRLLAPDRFSDPAAFDDAIEKWREFRTDYAKFVFGGMTVNERLFTAGTLEAFDRACAARDDDEVRRLLRDVLVDEPSIDQIVERLA